MDARRCGKRAVTVRKKMGMKAKLTVRRMKNGYGPRLNPTCLKDTA